MGDSPIIIKVAHEFSRLLREEVGEEGISQIIAENEKEKDVGICHSHDLCDANMVMEVAFRKVVGRVCNPHMAMHRVIWNDAWDYAKHTKFQTGGDNGC